MFSRSTHITLLERLCGAGAGGDSPDHEAWRDFHARYGELIRGYGRVRGVQPADCDDLVQDVMVSLSRVMRRGDDGSPGFVYDPAKGSFRSYLKTTVVHAIAKKARQNRPATGIEGLEGRGPEGSGLSDASCSPTGDEQWEQQWRQHHARLAMRTVEGEFNATDLEAFQRYALMRHDAAVVAKDLRVSVESVYQAKSRIVKRLGVLIEQQVKEEG